MNHFGSGDDYSYGITVTETGNAYISGAFYSPSVTVGASVIGNPYGSGASGVPNAYIAEFSGTAGMPVWAQAGGGSHGSLSVGITSDPSGNVYMTGGYADSSIAFGGTTINQVYPAASGKMALFLVQYSPGGTANWGKTIGSATAPVWGYGVTYIPCGQVWVDGTYTQEAVMDADTIALVGFSTSDPIFIAGYDISGSVVGHSTLMSGGDDQHGIASDATGNIFVCSDFESEIIIGPNTLVNHLWSAGPYEQLYIGKYDNSSCPTSAGNLHQTANNIRIFPNPATDELTIESADQPIRKCTITNSIGQVMVQLPVRGSQANVNVSNLPPGLYYVMLDCEDGVKAMKFEKM